MGNKQNSCTNNYGIFIHEFDQKVIVTIPAMKQVNILHDWMALWRMANETCTSYAFGSWF